MKNSNRSVKRVLVSALVFVLVAFGFGVSAQSYYQIKVYNLDDASQESQVDNYLKNAYLPALHRTGVKTVGVFKPIADNPDAGKKIFVFIPLKKLEQIETLDKSLLKDDQFLADGKNYIDASSEKPPFQRVESIILKPFGEMKQMAVPKHSTPPSERIYELRSYEGPTEKKYRKKVEMFNQGGEVKIFKELEFQPVFFAEVLSGSAMPNLMYMTTFSNMKSHDEHWDSFRNHPDWKALSAKEEYKGTVSHSDVMLLHPTDYSDF